MNLTRYSAALALCGSLVACGGSQKPAVEPVAAEPKAETPAVEAAKTDAAPVKEMTEEEVVNRYSYALGMNFGRSISETVSGIDVPLNKMVMMNALLDVMEPNRKVLMTDSVAEGALQDLLLKMQTRQDSIEKASAKKALDEQMQFLAKNIMDTTVKVTPKGVQYKVVRAGSGISPKVEDQVLVHYVGSLLDGSEFDNSIKRGEPVEFPVGAVIEGWQDLLMVLKEGDKVQAWIPSELAYGAEGVPPMIPANAMLVFEVELLKVNVTNPAPAAVAPAEQSAADSAAVETAPAVDSAAVDSAAAPVEVVPAAPAETVAPAADTSAVVVPAEKSTVEVAPAETAAPVVETAPAATVTVEAAPAAQPAAPKAEEKAAAPKADEKSAKAKDDSAKKPAKKSAKKK